MWQFLLENLTVFPGNSEDFEVKLLQFCWEWNQFVHRFALRTVAVHHRMQFSFIYTGVIFELVLNVFERKMEEKTVYNANQWMNRIHKGGCTLIISRVSTCSCTISWTILWDCEPIAIHFSQYHQFCSSLILRETWWETCHIALFDILWKYQSPGENGETRDEKNDWQDGLQNVIYILLVSLVSPTFFRFLVNLTISVV